DVYRAMRKAELFIASNLGAPQGWQDDPPLQPQGPRTVIDGVVEVPVFSYLDMAIGSYRHRRCLTITGCSRSEIGSILREAERRQISPVVILTHPREFAKVADMRFERVRRNRVNQGRFAWLCRFLDRHRDRFTTVRFQD